MNEFIAEVSSLCVMYLFYTGLAIPIGMFLMSYAVPEPIIKKYFRSPYFNDGDDQLFELFPFRYYLTLWIAQYTASNWFASRRKMYDLRKDSPRYWLLLSWIFFWLIVVPPISAFFISAIGFGYLALVTP